MWFIGTIVLFCVIIALMDWRRLKNAPPGPRGLPIIGNILDLKNLVKQTGTHGAAMCQLAKQYGPIVGLQLGFADPLIIISGHEAVVEMLGRQDFDARPKGFIYSHRTLGERRGVIFTDGKVYSDHRRFSLKVLKDFGWATQTMEELILEDAVNMLKVISEVSKKGPVRDITEHTALAVLNSIWFLVSGTRCDVSKGDPEITRTLEILNESFQSANISGGLLNQLPFLRHIAPEWSGYKKTTERLYRLWSFFDEHVTSHKKTRQPGVFRDLIDVYLNEMEIRKDDPTSTFDEMQLVALIKDLFGAGVDTTNNTTGFTIGYLTIYPEVQAKLQEELDRVIGRDNLPSIKMRPLMPYTNATLHESLRLANIGPTTIPHRALRDTEFRGYKIKKNSMLLANLMSVHLDENYWQDPEIFRPERFLDENNEFVPDPRVMAFGAGRRKCLGENLARNSHFLFVTCLFQKFKFSLPPGDSPPSMLGRDGFIVTPPLFDILITPR